MLVKKKKQNKQYPLPTHTQILLEYTTLNTGDTILGLINAKQVFY